jgi:putative cardiolipin synthase
MNAASRRASWAARLGAQVPAALAAVAALAAIAALAGCSSLPPRGPVPQSQAIDAAQTATTRLGRVVAASMRHVGAAGAPEPRAATNAPAPTRASSPSSPSSDGAAPDSGFRLLPTGDYAFDARAALIAAAERSIDAQYYHVHADSAGAAFLAGLRDAARRGVRVRLLVDDYHAGEVFDLLRALATEPTADVRIFNPLLVRWGSPLVRLLKSWPEFERVNRRMHNKLFVADNQVAIFGGRNVADEYFMRSGAANFIDLDVLAAGAVVPQLSSSFDDYWNSEHAWPIEQVSGAGHWRDDPRAVFERRLAQWPLVLEPPPADPLGQTSVRAQLADGRLQLRAGRAEVQADLPSKLVEPVVLNQPSAAMRGKLARIATAREEVVIVNPYFIPGEVGMRMMTDASRRGVRGLIFTNSLGSTDEPLVHRAYSRYRAAMLELGMRLFELNPVRLGQSNEFGNFGRSTARLHVKGAAIDRRWLLVGSVNLDGRSALFNTELSVNIECPELVSDAMAMLGGPPWSAMYTVTLAGAGGQLAWRAVRADNGVEVVVEEPHDSWWQRFVHWLQSLFVAEEQL